MESKLKQPNKTIDYSTPSKPEERTPLAEVALELLKKTQTLKREVRTNG
ncbi:MAG: hypothetical protein G01um10147_791 [Microgenomates group bacterium Gr01-1014_7]|nr:MAG: hypothetical protein G01um10147_791 [Microgenomates group bacterium Gr01-1014_7]